MKTRQQQTLLYIIEAIGSDEIQKMMQTRGRYEEASTAQASVSHPTGTNYVFTIHNNKQKKHISIIQC